MACQCYLNFVAADATAASCPKTGVCTHALDLKQVILLDIGQDFRYWIWMLGLIPWKITLIAKIPVFRTKSGHFRDSLWLKRSHFMFYIKSDSFFLLLSGGHFATMLWAGQHQNLPLQLCKDWRHRFWLDFRRKWIRAKHLQWFLKNYSISFNSPIGTYNMKTNQSLGNTTSPMLFEMGSDSTGVKCQLELTFDCWEDWPTARDNRQVTFCLESMKLSRNSPNPLLTTPGIVWPTVCGIDWPTARDNRQVTF